jgi:nicotinate-nucleotide adenylyltransferase
MILADGGDGVACCTRPASAGLLAQAGCYDEAMQEADHRQGAARRVAFFGGSFDPPHLGHLAVARAARAALELDTVLFAPVGAQPLKTQGSTASYEDRLEMTRLAIAGEPGFEVSQADAPKPSGEPNYTLETLEKLGKDLCGDSGHDCLLFFLMGADSFLGLRKWHRAAEIPFAAPLIVASRPGQKLEGVKAALPPGLAMEATARRDETRGGVEVRTYLLTNQVGDRAVFYLLPELDFPISASAIRKGFGSRKQSTDNGLVPEVVAGYVRAHGLYS